MGEVTNAYVTIKNRGTSDLPSVCATLRAIDEDREHPDKTKCVATLPANHQVTLKLTVDSHYQVGTVIQVDVTSNGVIASRVDRQACTDIDILKSKPGDLGVVKPVE